MTGALYIPFNVSSCVWQFFCWRGEVHDKNLGDQTPNRLGNLVPNPSYLPVKEYDIDVCLS